MTNEEAISYIRDILAENNSIKPSMVVFELEKEALYMAIKALEQVPCDDAISRADAKKYLSAPNEDGDRVIYEDDLDLLPSVTPQQKIGQWEVDEDCIYTCNQCNKRNLWHSLFCPNCGAKMEGDIK